MSDVIFVRATTDLHVPKGEISGPGVQTRRWSAHVRKGAIGMIMRHNGPTGRDIAFELPDGLTIIAFFWPEEYSIVPDI
jgi:hypothetical protein